MIKYIFIVINILAIILLFCGAISDIETRTVSDRYTYLILVLSAIKIIFCIYKALWYDMVILLAGGLVIFLVYLICDLILNRGGGADLKATSAIGLCFGLSNILIIMIISIIFLTIYVLYRKKKHNISIKEKVPYLPFLLIGTVFCFGISGGL